MSVDTRHPLYVDRLCDWEQLRDTYRGERRVKDQGQTYLPATSGQRADGLKDGQPGLDDYKSYKARAVFPDFMKQAVDAMVGLMHREPARIEVPARMEPMLERMTVDGESAHTLLRKINEHQLRDGRCGLLLEVPDGRPAGETLPFVAFYEALSIINWDDGFREQGQQATELVVLDESEFERKDQFQWDFEIKYRVLIRSAQVETRDDGSDGGQAPAAAGVYQSVELRDSKTEFTDDDPITPQIAGRSLEQIPFVFVNTNDLVSSPDEPPLLGLSNLTLAIYRGEADYRQGLHMQAQETFVVIGAELKKGQRVGAGAKIELPKDSDAKFVGVSADGLDAMRTSLEDDRGRAGDMTTRLMDGDADVQSGRALNVRLSAKTATLHQIAMTGAEALQRILRIAAEWMGLNPEEVIVEPNMDFEDDTIQGQALLQLMQAKQLGLPLSNESIHRWLRSKDLTEMEFEEEEDKIEQEMEERMTAGGPGSPDDPFGDPQAGDDPESGEEDDET